MKAIYKPYYLQPSWPAATHVHAYSTTRIDGYSRGAYAGFNLANHVGDDEDCVMRNRDLLRYSLNLPNEPRWLQQTHSSLIVNAEHAALNCQADATFTLQPNTVCVVLTADCLPILLCDQAGTCVAAIHAGWRGLVQNIIGNALHAFSCEPRHILAWLGPAIGPSFFEIGSEVKDQFIHALPSCEIAFQTKENNRYLANIYTLAKQYLHHHGVTAIYSTEECTYSHPQWFYSYRREGQTGRMASLIYLSK